MIPARIGITLGDPGGIGPEVVVKVLSRPDLPQKTSFILFGHGLVVAAAERSSGLSLDRARFPIIEPSAVPLPSAAREPAADNGAASFAYFVDGVRAAREGRIDALVTGPVSKAAWGLAGLPWRGHTEYLEHLYPGAVMAFWSDRLKLALLSHHLPLREAVGLITRERLRGFLIALARAVDAARPGAMELLVAGLNPHAGEDGRLGREEIDVIGPAIADARAEGVRVLGPFPPDAAFRAALDRPDTLAVGLYHDQGLIAFKLVAFTTGVNVTLGLPFVRTSPDHGTAFDIAGKNRADPGSMVAAVALAAEWAIAKNGEGKIVARGERGEGSRDI
jgi:4-hydroxythreonine-4-phosphate dehydrogenase